MQAPRRVLSLLAFCAILLGLLATVVTPANAAATNVARAETNAQRMARGLNPLAPRGLVPDRTKSAPRNYPSSAPGTCAATLKPQCCEDIESSKSNIVVQLLKLLGINLKVETQVGLTCNSNVKLCAGVHLCCGEVLLGGLLSLDCEVLAAVHL